MRRGYVLLVTLGLLVLSTTLLVAIGRSAANHVLEARLQQSDLQHHWGTISCRLAVLTNAERILVAHEQQGGKAAGEYRSTIQLGQDQFTLVVSDEQAKANVNSMIDQYGLQAAEDRVRETVSGTGLINQVRLRPAADDSVTSSTQQSLAPELVKGPGQIFDAVKPQLLINPRPNSAAPLQALTCWGGGSLNLMRASEVAMRAALMPTLSRLEISRLLAARDQIMQMPINAHPGSAALPAANVDAIGSLLNRAKIDAKVRNRLSVTTRSVCHSLWIIEQSPQRQWFSLTVLDQSRSTAPVIESIVW